MNNPVNDRLKRYWIGGLISGIGSLFGGTINAASQEAINSENIQAQREENALNRQFTEDMYNKYESPVAQAQQMREAGLNPMGAISPQSVGSASTSALPAGQAPQWGNALQSGLESFWSAGRALREQRLLDQEIDSKILENWMTEFENGTADERFRAEMEKLSADSGKTREERRLLRDQRKHLELEYKMAKDAYDKGINSHVDAHNESEARVDQIRQDISTSLNSMINDNIRLDTDLQKHDIYKKFANLQYQEQEQLLTELLDTWDVRESLLNSDISVKKMLVDQLTRSDELQKEKHKYDMAVANSVASAIENGEPVDAVLLKALAENPTSALALTTQLISTINTTASKVIKSQNDKGLPSGAFRH